MSSGFHIKSLELTKTNLFVALLNSFNDAWDTWADSRENSKILFRRATYAQLRRFKRNYSYTILLTVKIFVSLAYYCTGKRWRADIFLALLLRAHATISYDQVRVIFSSDNNI